jgi:hypothetical protein
MDAIHGTNINTGGVFRVDARFGDDVSHSDLLKKAQRTGTNSDSSVKR